MNKPIRVTTCGPPARYDMSVAHSDHILHGTHYATPVQGRYALPLTKERRARNPGDPTAAMRAIDAVLARPLADDT